MPTKKAAPPRRQQRRSRPPLPLAPVAASGDPPAFHPVTQAYLDNRRAEEAELDALIEQNTLDILEGHRATFEGEQDPFAAWAAFAACRRRGREIPAWVLAYFDRITDGLQEVYSAKRGVRPRLLARALGFTRSGAPQRTQYRDADLVALIDEKVAAAGGVGQAHMKTSVHDVAAQFFGEEAYRLGRGLRTVERSWRAAQKKRRQQVS